jgi:hypothetical protein
MKRWFARALSMDVDLLGRALLLFFSLLLIISDVVIGKAHAMPCSWPVSAPCNFLNPAALMPLALWECLRSRRNWIAVSSTRIPYSAKPLALSSYA